MSAELTVVDGDLGRTVWTLRDEVRGLVQGTAKLGGVVNSVLAGTYSPAAVLSPADDAVAYSSFLRQRPVVRVHDLRTGRDAVLDEGAYSLAWNRGGGLAYFKGLKSRVDDVARYRGHVVVRSSVDSKRVRWTAEAGRYVVGAWARDRLVVHELRRGWPSVVVFDAPKRRRLLAERAALVALSPDGTRAFVARQPDPSPTVSVVEIADGREVATFTFADESGPMRGKPIDYVAGSGAWTGDTVVAPVTSGVAVFRVRRDEIVVEELLRVDPDVFPLGLSEVKIDETGRYFAASAELMQRPRAAFPRVALMECDRVERHCLLGPGGPSFLPPRLVYNPSRP